ncbi:hypothetical protein [Brevibacillus panacihumi]|uniref:Uncharacterized protein n=1 Tax=Brevibacillus panacihumi TaxID=497735 RepID=A0A3M8DA30_9BACL|nr:hypothetical protein [Brevibacillus panacihumi]RNB84902.1 hypothetical protein EDM58_04290 [Brevibacillus panacihumi]
MRKILFGILGCFCFILIIGVWSYFNRPSFLYPALPFSHPDKSSVVAKLKQADDEMLIPLTTADSDTRYYWLGAKSAQSGEAKSLKSLLQTRGWTFAEQEGAGYFFEKEQQRIVITAQMWSSDFVLYKVPAEVPADLFQ